METYLFDFDGTLVDSMPSYVSVMVGILDERGIPYPSDIVKTITPLGILGTARHLVSIGLDMTVEEYIEKAKEGLYDAYCYHIPAKPHVIETLETLKAEGADLNILTASPHITLDACLKRLGIYDLFTNVWSCDDFATTKTDPNIYVQAAERIGKPVGEIWFLDDNLDADRTAKAAGMKVCGVYDDSSAEYVEDIKAVTDRYIYDFKELRT